MRFITLRAKKIVILILKKNELESSLLRRLFRKWFGISVGLYSYGCFEPKRIPRNTLIGRYCSFAPTSYIFNGNHGVSFLTTHPYLYNTNLGVVKSETISRQVCVVEDDVWLGHNSIILPSVKRVGRGAIIAAGAVVTKDVPKYAIMAGNPAKLIKYRFSPEAIQIIENSEWWNMDKVNICKLLESNSGIFYNPTIKNLGELK